MRAFVAGLGIMLTLAAAHPARAAGASPIGRWQTEGGWSHIRIFQCGPHLCGQIVWLKEPLTKDGRPKVDTNNPDQAKRAQTIVGLTIMWNFAKSSDSDVWEGGRIYNPEDGDIYKSKMKLRADGKLEVRGYIGISLLGGSQYWERVR